MSPDRYRDASFLDPRANNLASSVYTFNLDDLLLYNLYATDPFAPVHFIFHTAFCCSTLLTRCLDLIPPFFTLREPSVLAQIAMLRPGMNPAPSFSQSVATMEEWRVLMELAIRLLTRTYSSENVVVIKVNDLCNSMGDALLSSDARARIVFLYVSLRTFILSVLKRQSRRVWLRTRLRDTRKTAEEIPELANVHTDRLRDAEAAAYLWLLNKALYNKLHMGEHSPRVLAFDGDRVAENLKAAIADIAVFFHVAPSEETLDQLASHPYVSHYSKDLSIEYDRESRRQAMAEMETKFGMEANRGIEWASGMKQPLEFEDGW